MKNLFLKRLRAAAAILALTAAAAPSARAADSDLAFTVKISGNTNVPTLTFTNNSPLLNFNQAIITVGNTAYNFDGNSSSTVAPPNGTAGIAEPVAGARSDRAVVNLSNFTPGSSFSVNLDVDIDTADTGEDYRHIFFANDNPSGNPATFPPNTVITLYSGPKSVVLTLPENLSKTDNEYTFRAPVHNLTVQSVAETGGTDYVRVVEVKVDGITRAQKIGPELTIEDIPVGAEIEIAAPLTVYRDINGKDITNSIQTVPALVDTDAEERFSALGISVNNVPQTGDPSLYRFEFKEDTRVELRWKHEYALTVKSNFANTESTTVAGGKPIAGPLSSQASGNPVPEAQKHWIKRGEPAIAQIDGAVVDLLAQPGLDIRYVVKSYHAFGPPNRLTNQTIDSERLAPIDGGPAVSPYGEPKLVELYESGGSGVTKLKVTNHGLSNGMRVRIAHKNPVLPPPAPAPPVTAYDGDYPVTVVNDNQFTIPVPFNGNAADTAVRRLVDIRTPRTAALTNSMAANPPGDNNVLFESKGHGLRVGATIIISGSSNGVYDGEWTVIAVPHPNAFEINTLYVASATRLGSWVETTYVKEFAFNDVEQRQQVDTFNMWGPAGITYNWQIQYGVRVNVDDARRNGLAKVYRVNGNALETVGTQDGVRWFDPRTRVRIMTAASVPNDSSITLNGWLNGDEFYFPSTGTVRASDGSLQNTVISAASQANWMPSSTPAAGATVERGLDITHLDRPVRVMWRYGTAAEFINVTIGEYVFQHDDVLAAKYAAQPGTVMQNTLVLAPGVTQNGGATAPSADDVVKWDPVAGRLYPLIPAQFTLPWTPEGGSAPVDVIINAELPHDLERGIHGHYPHVAGSPAVNVDPDPADNFTFISKQYSNCGGTVDGSKLFTAPSPGFTVLLFSEIQRDGRGQPREFLRVRVVDTKSWNDPAIILPTVNAAIGSRILDAEADKAQLKTGYVRNHAGKVRYNPFVYDAGKLDGIAAKDIYDMRLLTSNPGVLSVVDRTRLPGPVFPVNQFPGAGPDEMLTVVWYDNPARNDTILWPFRARTYNPVWPAPGDTNVDRIVIASQWGSETPAAGSNTNAFNGDQVTAGPVLPDFPNPSTTYDPSRLQALQIYQQPDKNAPGYNPNEEHALIAPSLRFADVSPRPPAVYALRNNDLNTYQNLGGGPVPLGNYTSHPFVLVQFFDTATRDYAMKLYRVQKEDPLANITFANITQQVNSPATLNAMGHVEMEAGEPVIPFYPLGVAIGASPAEETYGNNLEINVTGARQLTYWEDHKGSSWAVSGGDKAWFTSSFYYPLAPDFYWPPDLEVPPVKIVVNGAQNTAVYDQAKSSFVPQTGDNVAFLPNDATEFAHPDTFAAHIPIRILYHSNWPENPPVLKAGETLTYSGGENRADNPVHQIVKADGTVATVETPGLPQVLAFASAEIVFDSLNPQSVDTQWSNYYTARVIQALDVRRAPLSITSFSTELQPATGRTRVSGGKYVFNDLPASLQKRFRYDPIGQNMEFTGFVNDRDIGANDLTAAPPAVYVLEPNILTADDVAVLKSLVVSDHRAEWEAAINNLAAKTRNPNGVGSVNSDYLVGLETGSDGKVKPNRLFGPGLAVVPNDGFLNPTGTLATGDALPSTGWITVVENNDPSLGGSPITPHIIKVDRTKRYRGSIKTILSDNVFDENIVLRHTGDFGTKAGDLYFEWYYRPDDGSLNVPPPDLLPPGTPNPWKLFPDPSGNRGRGRYEITLKGNPNAPETLLADTWWFCRYRHANDKDGPNGGGNPIIGSNWGPNSTSPPGTKKYDWAGAGNSDPFHDFNLDGIPDYRAQLASGWIKRVLDAVNPYEARIRDFEGENPATVSSMIAQFGPRYEGPVALNPNKDVIENVGLIELYETILKRGRDLSVDLSRPVSTPAVANALELVSTRLSDFYTLLGNEAYTDAQDPTIGFGSDSVDYGSLAPAVFAFQNQQPDLLGEELALLRGVDDFFARPVYNRLFWNFTKGEGEAAYAMNYNMTDINMDGFIDEDDAMKLFPMGHGDAWGHYLTALRHQYDLLRHPFFNWVSRSESYNLQDIVITVDFYDERKFAATAAAKAKAGAEIVRETYRDKYVNNPDAQWQGYTDTNPDRAWGVDEWARRAGQGAYFDWITANALLPSEHPNTTLEGVQKVDRESNADIAVISANLSAIQSLMDQSNRGENPLGLSHNALVFDIDPTFLEVGSTAQIGTRAVQGLLHFDQIYERALKMLENAQAIWDNANEPRNMLRQVGNSEAEFRNATFQEDLSYKNRLIEIFGKPYEGTIGPGKIYPAGYEGPDLALYMYVPVRQINKDTVPGPTIGNDQINSGFAGFDGDGNLSTGDLYNAFNAEGNQDGSGGGTGVFHNHIDEIDTAIRQLFTVTFSSASNMTYNDSTTSGLFAVNYTDLTTPKVPLTNFIDKMPVTAAGYTFQAPPEWGIRRADGELQSLITQMLIQEAAIAEAVGAWDALSGQVVRTIRLINARLTTHGKLQTVNESFSRTRLAIEGVIKGLQTIREVTELARETHFEVSATTSLGIPVVLPTAGFAVSPGDALSGIRVLPRMTYVAALPGYKTAEGALKIAEYVSSTLITAAENELELFKQREEKELQVKEWLADLENLIGDEPIRRIQIFKQIQTLHDLSNQYRSKLDEGARLIDERSAFNKRVSAQTQRNRYQDMTFRVARNHALQAYRSQFDLAARYAWLAAKAYDYETNYADTDPGSPQAILSDIVRARTIGLFDDQPRRGAGGLCEALATLKANYESQRGQLGLNTPQRETGKMSLRTQLMRILPKGSDQPQPGEAAGDFPGPGLKSDDLWTAELNKARVPDLWDVPEFRYYCRPFAPASDAAGTHVPQPGLVFRFGSEIMAGKNFFGKPLNGGDQAYDPTNYTTKIVGVGVWFSDYLSSDVVSDLATAPRVYLVPAGSDIMRVPHSSNPNTVRVWNVLDQSIPVPLPALNSSINNTRFIPILDTLNGPAGEVRKFSSFRAYHNGEAEIDFDELVTDSRLIGRSVWNTEWILIVPGQALNADPNVGLDRFIQQISDISIVFETYGLSGG